MNYLGIDNGISGALALIGELGNLMMWIPMPIQKTRKGNEVDVCAVWAWLVENCIMPGNTIVIIEEPGGSKSAKAASSMAGAFHALRALFSIKDYKLLRTTPQAWQKGLLKCKAGDTKPVALTLARSLWRDEKWLTTPRCTKPHDGAIDGALIAEWARREKL
jgi:hypothetical protein